ncbi:hypothetical protein TSOC_002694 [Tetrabaena socialis]|uniref:RING-CH-type domain-containing protein n=1 Tax=Tetrabaena socialis TaxID=47790 RepID=A0A2J8ADH8_9CHLO|nr:hypothetical protein TSOC_002694 [Tetrabaena socialis]|eukprot:PNH10567.1 hypothetical protein TSOC_002694 [Tetrabaena socialis]
MDCDESTCWICLEEEKDASTGPPGNTANTARLIRPCKCPRVVHAVCLAKWQLAQVSKSEEKFCRFCKDRLPDWQENLALPGMAAVEPVMSVHFNGHTHMVKVKPGEAGRLAFIGDVRRLLRLREHQEFSIAFECRVPGHGMFLDLKGLSSYDAAVFCAAMTAVERQRLARQRGKKGSPSARAQQRHRQAQALLQGAAAAPAAPSPAGTTPTAAAAAARGAQQAPPHSPPAAARLVEPLPARTHSPLAGASGSAAPLSAADLASPTSSAPVSALLPSPDGAGPSSDASRDPARAGPAWDSACEVGPAGDAADVGGPNNGAVAGGARRRAAWLRRKSRSGAGGGAGEAGEGAAAGPAAWLRRVLMCVQGGGAF